MGRRWTTWGAPGTVCLLTFSISLRRNFQHKLGILRSCRGIKYLNYSFNLVQNCNNTNMGRDISKQHQDTSNPHQNIMLPVTQQCWVNTSITSITRSHNLHQHHQWSVTSIAAVQVTSSKLPMVPTVVELQVSSYVIPNLHLRGFTYSPLTQSFPNFPKLGSIRSLNIH